MLETHFPTHFLHPLNRGNFGKSAWYHTCIVTIVNPANILSDAALRIVFDTLPVVAAACVCRTPLVVAFSLDLGVDQTRVGQLEDVLVVGNASRLELADAEVAVRIHAASRSEQMSLASSTFRLHFHHRNCSA